jgi:hypothetical protein
MSDSQNFDWASFARWAGGLDRQGKTSFLARVAHELTVLARDTYEPGTRGVTDPSRLRAINEVMHRLTRRVLTLSRESQDDWNEAEFWKVLSELAEPGGCLDDLISAVSTASGSRAGA